MPVDESADGRNVAFVNDAGAAVVNDSGLTVFDAAGAAVPSWFATCEFDSSFTNPLSSLPIHHPQFVRIVVDDSSATYPLTIDSIAQQAYPRASNTGANDQFDWSVAVSGDTVVIGAPLEDSSATGVNGNQADNSATNSGAAYVFAGLGPQDADGDGVGDACDVCSTSAPGLPVDCDGRPLRDCNNDCLVDGADVPCIVNELVGP